MKNFIKKCPLLSFTILIAVIAGAYFAVKYIPTENVTDIFNTNSQVESSDGNSSQIQSGSSDVSGTSSENVSSSSGSEQSSSNSSSSVSKEEPKEPIVKGPVDDEFFSDALFIGDSITEGLCGYGNIKTADYFYHIGLSVNQLFNKPKTDDRTGKTLEQTLKQKQYKKIYIHLGINELGTGTADSFSKLFANTVSKIHEYDPDALIFIDSIFPVTKEKSDKDKTFKIATVNQRNEALASICDNKKVFFLNLTPCMDDGNGYMKPDFSNDSTHPKAKYYPLVCDQIKKSTAEVLGIEQ